MIATGHDLPLEMIELNTVIDLSSENRAEKSIREVPLLDVLRFLQVVPRVLGAQAEVPFRDQVAVPGPDQVILRQGVPPKDRFFFISNSGLI